MEKTQEPAAETPLAEDDDYNLFNPQTNILSLEHVLERIVGETSGFALRKLDEEKWEEDIANYTKHEKFDEKFLDGNEKEIDYKWSQEGDYIQIVLEGVNEDSILFNDKDNSITIFKEGRDFPILSGKFWGKTTGHTVSVIDKLVEIDLDLESEDEWPLLIKGGRMVDGLSCYYISILAQEIKNTEAALYFLQRGAMAQNHYAALSYALLTSEDEDPKESVHFYARCVLLCGDHIAGFCLANHLISGEGVSKNPPVAEYMLCRLCKEQFTDAFYRLGLLYLKGAEGVKPMPLRAKKIFQIALAYGDSNAAQILDSTDWAQYEKKKEEEKKEEEEKKKKVEEESGTTALDIALSTLIVAGIASFGYMALKKLRTKLRK